MWCSILNCTDEMGHNVHSASNLSVGILVIFFSFDFVRTRSLFALLGEGFDGVKGGAGDP